MKRSFAQRATHEVFTKISIFFALFAFAPLFASADTVSAYTAQILPAGGTQCQPLVVTNVAAHVYGGTLQSADIAVSDQSYVPVGGTVGETSVPFTAFSRWIENPGMVIHIDTPTTPVAGNVPVSITLLSAKPGTPVCATTISFTVTASSAIGSHETPASSQPSVATNSGKMAQNKAVSTSATNGKKAVHEKQATSTSIAAGLGQRVSSLCAVGNSYRLWFILLLAYVIAVTVIAFANVRQIRASVFRTLAAILAPLIVLLGFWYFSPSCRAASWIPVAACIIAIAGLFLSFRERGPESPDAASK